MSLLLLVPFAILWPDAGRYTFVEADGTKDRILRTLLESKKLSSESLMKPISQPGTPQAQALELLLQESSEGMERRFDDDDILQRYAVLSLIHI